MNEIFILIATITFFIMIYIYFQKTSDLIYIKSSVDGNKYLVQKFKDSKKAADLLSNLVTKIEIFKKKLLQKYPQNENVIRFNERFDKKNIMENNSNYQYTSYSVNKGEKMIFCIRTRDKENKLIDLNTIVFVGLHEIAHLMSKSTGHTEEFWKNFKFLLGEAEDFGIYKNINYSKYPKKYCGMTITDNPFFD